MADIEMIAAMKAAPVHDRGAKRDFIDIHAICTQPGWSVGRFIEHAARLLPFQPEQVGRALTYYVDAEEDPMPAGCAVSWEKAGAVIAGPRIANAHRSITPPGLRGQSSAARRTRASGAVESV